MKLHSVDQGFCRINYVTKNADNRTIYYCIQEDSCGTDPITTVYRCTQDGEPDYPVSFKGRLKELFPLAPGNTAMEHRINNFILERIPVR